MSCLIKIFATDSGKEPFQEWLNSLKDRDTQALIFQRLQRIRLGNFGDCKSLSNGLWELRIHSKSGLRVYFTRVGADSIVIFCGGNKRSQTRDINKAKEYLEEYKRKK